MPDQPAHMTPEEFRRHGHAAIDWIADYWASLDDLPVRAQVAPGDVRRLLPASAPEDAEPFDAVLADLDRVVVPGLTHWQHPRFFAYFPANSSPAAILGDLLSSGIGAQGMIWATSPAVTEVEQVVLDWFAEALGLPEAFRSDGPGGGVIQDTASTATFTALLSALHRASGGDVRRHGVGDAGWRVYGSTQAHSSLVKAAMMAGLGEDAVRTIAVDPATQAMDVDALRAAIAEDDRGGAATGDGAPRRRQHVDRRDGRHRRRRGGGARHGRLAARRRRLGRRRRGLSRAPRPPRRRRARGLVRHQPAQVAADDLRLQHLLGARPGRPDRRAVDPPGVPPQRGHRVGRGRRLPRLAPAARPTVPRDQAVGGAAHLRARGAAPRTSAAASRSPSTSPTWSPPTTASRW